MSGFLAFLARSQRRAEALMTDTVDVIEVGDSTNLQLGETAAETTILASQACRTQRYDGQTSAEVQAGTRNVTLDRLYVYFPVAALGIRTDHVIRYLTSRDPELVGREFVVKSGFAKTYASSRRVLVEEVTA